MDLNAEMDHLIKTSQSWLPMIMEYGSRVLLALVTLGLKTLLELRHADQLAATRRH